MQGDHSAQERTLEEGEVRAIAALHERPLRGYVERLTGDQQEAEDIVQETFLRAWRAAPDVGSRDGALRAWLFKVARNLATDGHRARRSRPREVSLEAAADVPCAERAEHSLRTNQLIDAVRALRAEHRVAIVETFFRGRSVAETAARLGVPAGTVKSRCYYGLRALRSGLDRRGLLK